MRTEHLTTLRPCLPGQLPSLRCAVSQFAVTERSKDPFSLLFRLHPVKPMNTTAPKTAASSLGAATIISENLINEDIMKVRLLQEMGMLIRDLKKNPYLGSPLYTAPRAVGSTRRDLIIHLLSLDNLWKPLHLPLRNYFSLMVIWLLSNLLCLKQRNWHQHFSVMRRKCRVPSGPFKRDVFIVLYPFLSFDKDIKFL